MPDQRIAPSTRSWTKVRSYDRARPLIFMHVPKCSGTSLIQALLAAGMAHSVLSGFDRTLFGDFAAFESISEQVRSSIYLDENDLPKAIDFVAAHMSLSTLSRSFPAGQLLTLFREPISRLLSLWVFWRSHTDNQLLQWGDKWGDRVRHSRRPLVDFLRTREVACQTDNQLVRMLLCPHHLIPTDDFIDDRSDTALVQAAAERLARFSFLDLMENQALESNLANWLGRPVALGRFNETTNIPRSFKTPMTDELTDEAWALLGARSRMDLQLWLTLAAARVPQIDARLLRREAIATTISRHSQLMASSIGTHLRSLGRWLSMVKALSESGLCRTSFYTRRADRARSLFATTSSVPPSLQEQDPSPLIRRTTKC
jgi:hypothetical protein